MKLGGRRSRAYSRDSSGLRRGPPVDKGTQESRLRQELRAVREAVLAIGAGASLEQILQLIVDRARDVVGAQYAALGVGTDPERPFDPWVFSGISPEQAQAIGRSPRPVGVLGKIAREGWVLRVPDIRQHPAFSGWPAGHPEIRSFLGVPIWYQGQSVGNLYLGNKLGAAEFTEEDQQVIELLTAHAAVAIRQTRLLQTVEVDRARFQAILESAAHGVMFIDVKTGRLMANPEAVRLLGWPVKPEGGLDQFAGRIFDPAGRPLAIERWPPSRAARGETVREEVLVMRPDGSRVPLRVSAAPVRSPEGQVVGAVVIFEDITPLKELERLREEWTSIIAHDLRQPVTVITGYAGLMERALRRHGCPEEEGKSLEHIGIAARNLDRMIGDLLDVSRIEARRLKLERQEVDIVGLVRAVVERTGEVMKGHPVRVAVRGDIPRVWADPGRIEQVLGNLLSNAAKYSYPGREVVVEVEAVDGMVQVSVTNEGPGIAPEDMPKLFTRFHRMRMAREEGVAGLGLGLYISKGLVEAHGGRIWAESVPGKTTTFHFTVPLARRRKVEDEGAR